MNLDHILFLGISRNFSASIGSFQRLPAELLEVILLSQRLALKYNTTPRGSCQHFLTSFFQILCAGGGELPQSKPTALPAPSGREPLALPEALRLSRKLYRHAKGPISERAGIERSEMTGGVFTAVSPPPKALRIGGGCAIIYYIHYRALRKEP